MKRENMTAIALSFDQLPFFTWRGVRVMTSGMVDRLHGKTPKTTSKKLRKFREEFTIGRDVHFISGKDDLNAIPLGIPCRSGPELRLITESGYRILLRHLNDDLARKIRLSLQQQSAVNHANAIKPIKHENQILAKHSLPFFEWRGKRVMTFAMIDKLHELTRGSSLTKFCKCREEFVTGRDAFLISSAEAREVLPVGVDFYYGGSLWLITESGYLTLIRTMKNPQARKIRRSLRQQSVPDNINRINPEEV